MAGNDKPPIELHIDTSKVEAWAKLLDGLPEKWRNQVIVRTLNWVGDKARTQVVRATAEQSGVAYGEVRDAIKTFRARPGFLAYELDARGGYLTLGRFAPSQTETGVTARPWGETRTFPHAFIVRSLAPKVFIRTSRERFPIRPLYGPAIPREMTREAPHGKVPSVLTFAVAMDIVPRLEHELGFLLANEAVRLGLVSGLSKGGKR